MLNKENRTNKEVKPKHIKCMKCDFKLKQKNI